MCCAKLSIDIGIKEQVYWNTMEAIQIWLILAIISSVFGLRVDLRNSIYSDSKLNEYLASLELNKEQEEIQRMAKKAANAIPFCEYKILLDQRVFEKSVESLTKNLYFAKNLSADHKRNQKITEIARIEGPLLTEETPFKKITIDGKNKKDKKKVLLIQHRIDEGKVDVNLIQKILETIEREEKDIFNIYIGLTSAANSMFYSMFKNSQKEIKNKVLWDILGGEEITRRNLQNLGLDENISRIAFIDSFQYVKEEDIAYMESICTKEKFELKKKVDLGDSYIIDHLTQVKKANLAFFSILKSSKIDAYVQSNIKIEDFVKESVDLIRILFDSIRISEPVVDYNFTRISSILKDLVEVIAPEKGYYSSEKSEEELFEEKKEKIYDLVMEVATNYPNIYEKYPKLSEVFKLKMKKGIDVVMNRMVYNAKYRIDRAIDKLIAKTERIINSAELSNSIEFLVDHNLDINSAAASIKEFIEIKKDFLDSNIYAINEKQLPADKNYTITTIKVLYDYSYKIHENSITPQIFKSVYRMTFFLSKAMNMYKEIGKNTQIWDNLAFMYFEPCRECTGTKTFIVFRSMEREGAIYRKEISCRRNNKSLKAFYNAKTANDLEKIEGLCEKYSIREFMKRVGTPWPNAQANLKNNTCTCTLSVSTKKKQKTGFISTLKKFSLSLLCSSTNARTNDSTDEE